MIDLSIIIVNFNAGDYLLNCLSSLKSVRLEVNFEVWVVDNSSSDGSLEKAQRDFKEFNFISNSENLGFGRANNLALKKVKAPLVLFLNPDCEVKSGALSVMVNFMKDNPSVGASTCKVLLNNGQLDWATHRGFPTPLASLFYFLGNDNRYHLSDRDLNNFHEVDAISGAFFLTRKEILENLKGFDEDYFMYAEDLDLCFKIKKLGYKIMYVPTATTIHHKGISSGLKKHSQEKSTADLETKKRSLDAFYSTMKLFYRKHYQSIYPFFINWLIYLAINLKWFQAKRRLVV